MSDVDNPAQILEAIESFATSDPRTHAPIIVQGGTTRIAADHWLAKSYPEHFQPVADHLSYETEEMTDEPGRRRARPAPIKPGARGDREAAGVTKES